MSAGQGLGSGAAKAQAGNKSRLKYTSTFVLLPVMDAASGSNQQHSPHTTLRGK